MIIVGKTKDGEIFRPASDELNWAYRVCGWFINNGNKKTRFGAKIGYTKHMRPFKENDVWCLYIDDKYKDTEVWNTVMRFADLHELSIKNDNNS